MHSDSRRRLQNLSPSLFPFPTCSPASTPCHNQTSEDHCTPFTGLQDDLDRFKVECGLYIHLQGSKFPNKTSWMVFILSYMKGRAAGTWATHKIQQVLNPSGMPMTMDKFKAEVDLMFADLNREATA